VAAAELSDGETDVTGETTGAAELLSPGDTTVKEVHTNPNAMGKISFFIQGMDLTGPAFSSVPHGMNQKR
jgi:hypothetical protein